MNIGKTLFAQLMDLLPWTTFARYVVRYGGDKGVRTLTWSNPRSDQPMTLIFLIKVVIFGV